MIARLNLNALIIAELITCVLTIFFTGFFSFLGLVFAGMILGVLLLSFSFRNLSSLQSSQSIGKALQNAGLCFAGVLFIIPGILSSIAGVLVLFGVLIMSIYNKTKKSQDYEKKPFTSQNPSNDKSEIIDVEIIEGD